ncbi:MAG: hypothetical protein R6V56_08160 [Lentisphaeria bacterium]
MLYILICLTLLSNWGCRSLLPFRKVEVSLNNPRIAVPADADDNTLSAARDLLAHLQQHTESDISLRSISSSPDADDKKFTFKVGFTPENHPQKTVAGTGTGRYSITDTGVYFWSTPPAEKTAIHKDCPALADKGPAPLQAAVNSFLRQELKCRWLAPGAEWTSGNPALTQAPDQKLQLTIGQRQVSPSRNTLVLDDLGRFSDSELDKLHKWYNRFGATPCAVPLWNDPLQLAALPLPLGTAADIFARVKRRTQSVHGTPGGFLPHRLRDYAVMQTMLPDAPNFSTVLSRYSEAFGEAAPNVRKYYRYWISHYRNKVIPRLPSSTGPRSEFLSVPKFTYRHAEELYPESSLREAAAFLHEATVQDLTHAEKARLDQLLLAHTHTEFLLDTLRTLQPGETNPKKLATGIENATRLKDFRQQFKKQMGLGTATVNRIELAAGDISGLAFSRLFAPPKSKPLVRLGPEWHIAPPGFKLKNKGDAASLTPEDIKNWEVWTAAGNSTPPESGLEKYTWLAASFRFDKNPFEAEYALNFWALARPAALYFNGDKVAELQRNDFISTPYKAWRVALPPKSFAVTREKQVILVRLTAAVRPGLVSTWRAVWISQTPKKTQK